MFRYSEGGKYANELEFQHCELLMITIVGTEWQIWPSSFQIYLACELVKEDTASKQGILALGNALRHLDVKGGKWGDSSGNYLDNISHILGTADFGPIL